MSLSRFLALSLSLSAQISALDIRSTTPSWLNQQDLTAALSQLVTNGESLLGSLQQPSLPPFLNASTPLPQGYPWGSRTVNTNVYEETPDTGVTRRYTFTIATQQLAPDGVPKQGIVANGAFPGPTIEANWGDWIEVEVHNNLGEGTSLHWHGLLQKDTPYMDGVPGVHQCPIAPGESFTYRFRADLYGTSWWHSHYSAQYMDGLFGAIVIHGPQHADYDTDLGPVLLSDHFHESYQQVVEAVMAPSTLLPNLPPSSNNNLINGKMNYPCLPGSQCTANAGLSKFHFTRGKKHLLRLVNTGAEGIQKFSIDEHTLTVIANDFVPVQPYTATVVTLGVGQRTDVIVQANGLRPAYFMRSSLGVTALAGGCNVVDGISPVAYGAIYYDNAPTNSVPLSIGWPMDLGSTSCANDALSKTEPLLSLAPGEPDLTIQVTIDFKSNGTNFVWYMNDHSFRADYNDPTYLEAKLGQTTFDPNKVVFNVGDAKSIRFVLINKAVVSAHPMHIHGHNFYVLAEGYGDWDGQIVRASNPQRRDVNLLHNALIGIPSYMVIQIDGDNPGVWPFHCHIAGHVSGGLYLNILEQPDQIQGVSLPYTVAQTCRSWADWTGDHVVDQIDSGL